MIDETLDGVERAVDPVRGTRIFTKVALTFLAGALLIGFVGGGLFIAWRLLVAPWFK